MKDALGQKDATKPMEGSENADQRKRDRSPSFPFIGLEEALGRAAAFFKAEGKNRTTPEVAVTHWSYAAKSSGGLQTIGALRAFGLMDSEKGKLGLTQRALRILMDERENSQERQKEIREAALLPRLHSELWSEYGTELPSDPTLRTKLRMEKGFVTGEAADKFIKEYRETIAFAKLRNGGTLSHELGDKTKIQEKVASIGDYIQWESQGVFQLASPSKIIGFSEDGSYAFIEGTSMGVPVEQLRKVDGPPKPPIEGEPFREQLRVGVRREVFALDEGEAILQWPAKLTAEGFSDLEAWLNLIIKKAKRISKADPKPD